MQLKKMNNKKIAVYGVCKNEEKHVRGWFESIKDADYILLLDTGSTDNTVKIAKDLGIVVLECIIDSWDETLAKNIALSFIPKNIDYCFILDLDQRVLTNNWLEVVNSLKQDYDVLLLKYFDDNGIEKVIQIKPGIHSRFKNQWISYRPKLFNSKPTYAQCKIDIDVLNLPGDFDRYSNRDQLYLDTCDFYYLKNKKIFYYNLELIAQYALSAYEVEDFTTMNTLFADILTILKEKKHEVVNYPILKSLFIAKSLVNPENAEIILNQAVQDFNIFEKETIEVRLCILEYLKNNSSLCLKLISNIKEITNLSEEDTKIVNILKKYCSGHELSFEEKQYIVFYLSSCKLGRLRPELAQKTVEYFSKSFQKIGE
jgi:hypothetical protein